MAEVKVFDSRNDQWSKQTESGDGKLEPRYGWCAVASALWCLNALNGVTAAASKPSQLRSGLLQVKYRWNESGWADVELLALVGLNGQPQVHDVPLAAALDHMVKHPGVYYFGDEYHAMATDTRTAQPLFYDIESGLYRYGNAAEFKQGIAGRYQGGSWEVIEVQLAH